MMEIENVLKIFIKEKAKTYHRIYYDGEDQETVFSGGEMYERKNVIEQLENLIKICSKKGLSNSQLKKEIQQNLVKYI